MDIEQVKQDIESWIENFVEVPHPSLGGFAPCPYARQARLKRTFEIYLGTDPYYDLKNCARYGMATEKSLSMLTILRNGVMNCFQQVLNQQTMSTCSVMTSWH